MQIFGKLALGVKTIIAFETFENLFGGTMRGRKPLPTALKEAQGTLDARFVNKCEPKPELGAPKRPSHVKGAARREWNRVAPELVRLGLLTHIDAAALAGYCVTYARWQNAEAKLADEGLVVTTKAENEIQSPYLGIANTAMKLCHRFAVEFGFTPSSRSRLSVKPVENEQGLEDFLRE